MQPKQRTFHLVLFIIGYCIASACRAGDMAEFRAIGFAPGGKYFAFEQYGTQDGSGFPYSDIFIIETASDTWVAGTPIRVELEDESLTVARGLSAQRAAPLLKQFEISQTTQPLLNHLEKHDINGIGQFAFKLGEELEYSINLEQWQTKDARCQRYGVTPELFSLSINSIAEKQNKTRILHKDLRLPRSRGCPMEYIIHQVFISVQSKDQSRAIAVIMSVFTKGYEGRNRRYLAITSQFE